MSIASAGPKVFEVTLPLELAPSLNVYAGMQVWQRANLRKALDWAILAAVMRSWKGARLKLPRRRLVRCTRRSSRELDEVSVDVVGGKAPVDRLVQAEILAGDSRKWLAREAAWERAKPGDGSFLVEVFELS